MARKKNDEKASDDANIYLPEINKDNLEYVDFLSKEDTISSGSTILNLYLSNNIDGGYRKGTAVRIHGPEGSGKTALAVAIEAGVACDSERYKNYRTVYTDLEGGLTINLAKRYGKEVSEKIEVQVPEELSDINVQKLFQEAINLFENNAAILVTDSTDTLKTIKQKQLDEENKKLAESGKELKENAMMEAAKVFSTELPKVMSPLRKNNSLWLLISQNRATPNPYEKNAAYHVSGGNALLYYVSYRLNTKEVGKITKKDPFGNEHKIGQIVEVKILKNRGTGKLGEIKLALYDQYGFVDEVSVFDWLADEIGIIRRQGKTAWYVADWLTYDEADLDSDGNILPDENGNPRESKKFTRSDMINRFLKEPELFQKARKKCQEVWDTINADLAEIF